MKTRLSLLSAIRVLVFLLLVVWLPLTSVAAPAAAAPAGLLAETIVGGEITTDTTWTLAGSPYIVRDQNLTVRDNVTLTIEAGVTVQLNAGRNLWVYGTLSAVGTSAQPITFTRMAGTTGAWGMVQIGGGTVNGDSNASRISYATIEGGGAGTQMLYVYNSAATLDHLTLRNSGHSGLYATGIPAGSTLSWDTGEVTGNGSDGVFVYTGRAALSNLTVLNNGGDGIDIGSAHDSQLVNSTVQGNVAHGIRSSGSDRLLLQGLTVTGNAGHGLYMQSGGEGSVVRNTTVQGNGVAARLHPDTLLDGVTLTGNTRNEIEWITGRINSNRTWARLPEIHTYRVLEQVTVMDGVTLTVEPGVTVGVQQGMSLSVNGALSAVGTPTQPITFTRMAGATGAWAELQIGGGSVATDSDASRVSYATIEGGGSGGQMLYIYRSGPTLDHLTLRNSSTKGVYVGNVSTDSALSWDTGTVTGNGSEGVYVATGRIALSNLTIAGNGAEGIELNSADDSQVLNSTVQGNGGEGIRSSGSSRLLLEGLTIAGNTGYGIYVQFDGTAYGGMGSIVRDTTVQGNAVAARLHPDTVLDNVTWTGNTRSEIEWNYGRIGSNRTWARLPEIHTYRVLGSITVPDNTRLTVEPGVTVQLDAGATLYANGGLTAVGTPTQPVTFTRLPGATQPWGMIEIGSGNVHDDADDSRISYATIEGGGSTGKLVHLYYTSASLDHVTVRNSSSIGIQIYPRAGTQVSLDTVAVTNNAGVAIHHVIPGPSLSYRDLTLQGNGTDAVSIGSGTISSPVEWDLGDAGATVRSGSLYIQGGGFLALMPGTRLEFTAAALLQVYTGSGLYALGTSEAPVTLTGVLPQPGAWKGVWQASGSRAILRNCNVEYGGAAGEPALRLQSPGAVVVVNTSVRHAAADGVLVDDATPPLLQHNDISGNVFGVRNSRTTVTVDARNVWWGDASGPYHPTLNPGGLGNAVSDHVLFEPWLTSVPTGTVPLGGLILQMAGPRAASPGQSVVYGAVYVNETGQEIRDAVLVLALPDGASFEETFPAWGVEGGGGYWPERHQAFWRLGTLPPGASGTVAVRVRYFWGLTGTDSVLALMGGSNWAPTRFDLASYLAYQPLHLLSRTALTPADVLAERQAYPVLGAFYVQGEADGFVYASAARYAYATGTSRVVIRLDRPDRSASMEIVRQGQIVEAYLVDASGLTLRTVLGDMIYDRAIDATSFTGGLAGGARDPALVAAASSPEAGPSPEACTANCLALNSDTLVSDYIRRWFSGGSMVPPGSEAGPKCESECQQDPSRYFCQQNITTCDFHRPVSFFAPAPHRILEVACNKDTGRFEPGGTPIEECSVNPIEKCTIDDNANPVCEGCTKSEGCGEESTVIFIAKDPNAKYGPAGDLLPGDVVPYTVAYENVGEGIAYGVYVEDRLSDHFDEATLKIGHGGLYLPASRTILWEIGELGPKGSPTASGSVTFTVDLRTGLPGGTPIINQAIVYFPSAPEETPTNQVANAIWPVIGVPAKVTVQAGHSMPITLAGRDTGSGPLTFRVVNPPGRGTLAGSPPALTYTPLAGFSGQDLFTFSVSNAISESRPAEVELLVVPDPADKTPPAVKWTVPKNNAIVGPLPAGPAHSDSSGPVYLPYVFAGFSEAVDASTVTATTLLLTEEDGTAIPVTVTYSDVTGEAMMLLRQPLEPATSYTVRATRGIKDLAGNALAADYVWTFRTAGGGGGVKVYLPLVVKGTP
jgi:hypothetical protein